MRTVTARYKDPFPLHININPDRDIARVFRQTEQWPTAACTPEGSESKAVGFVYFPKRPDQSSGPPILLFGEYWSLFLFGWWVKLSTHLRTALKLRIRELLSVSYAGQSGVIAVIS